MRLDAHCPLGWLKNLVFGSRFFRQLSRAVSYRALTDERGMAKIKVAKGGYTLFLFPASITLPIRTSLMWRVMSQLGLNLGGARR